MQRKFLLTRSSPYSGNHLAYAILLCEFLFNVFVIIYRLIYRVAERQLGPMGDSQNCTPLRKFPVAAPFSFPEIKGNALFRYNC